jgi:hypothetical protein
MLFIKKSGRMLALFSLVVAFAGCSIVQPAATATPEPTQDLNAFRTEVAGTVVANLTVEAALHPSATSQPTQTPVSKAVGTATQPAAAVLSVTPYTTATAKAAWVVYPTNTRTPYTDAADFVSQSPLDGFTVGPGGDFDIVWTFKNVGLRAWNTSFYLRYLSGVKGSDATNYMVSAPVNVNDSFTFRVDMIAPLEPGDYVTTWQLINDDGVAILTPYLSFTVQ